MTRRAVAVGLGALVITTVAFVFANTAHATTSCAVTNVVVYGSGKRATFTVAGDCVVSLVSYELHGNGLAGQMLFDSSTKEFSTGSGELRITVPDCVWQTDLVLGQPRNPPTDYGNNVLGFRFGGEGQCPPPSTTTTLFPTTSTSPMSSTSTSQPRASTTTTSAVGVPASSVAPAVFAPATPTDLAHTGSDSLPVIALGALGLIGAGRYVEGRGKRRAG